MDLLHFNPSFFPRLLLLLALPLFSVFFSANCHSIGQCLQAESSALLQVKRGFITNKLETWRPGTDCCAWEGVTCDESRRVISLDLRERKMAGTIHPSLFNLTSLQTLNLGFNKFNHIPIPEFGWDRLTNLSRLNLSNSGFVGKVPAGISRLTKLISLDLSYYDEVDVLSFPVKPTFFKNMNDLRELFLDYVNLSAYGDEWCGGFANVASVLEVLSMLNCSLYCVFPQRIFQLRNLKYIDLSFNPTLSGSLPDFAEDSKLEILRISRTNFSGSLPDTIGNLKLLSNLYLASCQFSGSIPPSIGNLTQLLSLDLSDNNKLTGQVPMSLFHITGFVLLSLALNNFSGGVDLVFVKYMKNLSWLDLSNSGFSLNTWEADDVSSLSSFPYLFFLGLAGCNLIEIPKFIKYQQWVYNLDLSNNRINGEIPSWIWTIKEVAESLDADCFLSLANNKFSGELSQSICKLTKLRLLDLSMNELIGYLPPCLFEEGIILHLLNLKGNHLHGSIPDRISPKCELEAIILRDNQLEGLLPKSLSNCRSLEILDLANNNLKDTFPYWLGNMSSLRILVLGSNEFHGLVGPLDGNHKTKYSFSMLHVFDLSSNNFSGKLCEECFNNFKSMMVNRANVTHSFEYSLIGYHLDLDMLTIMNKGQVMTLQNLWKIFKSIDFSNNHFEGEIPSTIGQLTSLQVLNISHNNLTGEIPPQLGNLSQLESLDLSMNNLSGMIPQELVSLHFLSYLNLSYNKLEGKISIGGQFSTFPNTSFEGNEGLCWFSCNSSISELNEKNSSHLELGYTSPKNQNYIIVIGILFGVGLGVSMAIVIVLDVMCYSR